MEMEHARVKQICEELRREKGTLPRWDQLDEAFVRVLVRDLRGRRSRCAGGEAVGPRPGQEGEAGRWFGCGLRQHAAASVSFHEMRDEKRLTGLFRFAAASAAMTRQAHATGAEAIVGPNFSLRGGVPQPCTLLISGGVPCPSSLGIARRSI